MIGVELDVLGVVLIARQQINVLRFESQTLVLKHQPYFLGTGTWGSDRA